MAVVNLNDITPGFAAFLLMPLEMRFQIYEETFDKHWITDEHGIDSRAVLGRDNIQEGIRQACRQVRMEASIVLKRISNQFLHISSISAAAEVLTAQGFNISLVKRLEIVHWGDDSEEVDFDDLEVIRRALPLATSLKYIAVHFPHPLNPEDFDSDKDHGDQQLQDFGEYVSSLGISCKWSVAPASASSSGVEHPQIDLIRVAFGDENEIEYPADLPTTGVP